MGGVSKGPVMDFQDFSTLRMLGVIAGILMALLGMMGLRRVTPRGPAALLIGIGGVLMGAVSVFPGVASILTDLLSIGAYPGSRLIALLIVAMLILWVAAAAFGAQTQKTKEQLDRLIRHVAINDFKAATPQASIPDGAIIAILPALNEENNIGAVLRKMPVEIDGVPVRALVVDDGSTDNTAKIARDAGAFVIRSPFQRGGGAAIRLGFEAAERFNARVAVNIDSDGQNDPQEMPGLVRPILNDDADVVIGSRILGSHEITHWWRHAGVKLFSTLYNVLMGKHITDISSGYRAVRADRLLDLRLYQDQYHTSEFLVMCAKLGYRIGEAPIRFSRRISGTSKKGNEFLYGLRFARALLTAWARNN